MQRKRKETATGRKPRNYTCRTARPYLISDVHKRLTGVQPRLRTLPHCPVSRAALGEATVRVGERQNRRQEGARVRSFCTRGSPPSG